MRGHELKAVEEFAVLSYYFPIRAYGRTFEYESSAVLISRNTSLLSGNTLSASIKLTPCSDIHKHSDWWTSIVDSMVSFCTREEGRCCNTQGNPSALR